jgi:hypothetical protein
LNHKTATNMVIYCGLHGDLIKWVGIQMALNGLSLYIYICIHIICTYIYIYLYQWDIHKEYNEQYLYDIIFRSVWAWGDQKKTAASMGIFWWSTIQFQNVTLLSTIIIGYHDYHDNNDDQPSLYIISPFLSGKPIYLVIVSWVQHKDISNWAYTTHIGSNNKLFQWNNTQLESCRDYVYIYMI